MKSEHRHELKTNELAEFSHKVQPYVENYGTKVLVGFCVIVVAWAALWYWMRTSSETRSEGWTRISAAATAQDYLEVADEFAGKEVAVWARLKAAERQLAEGVQLAFTAREGEKGFVSDLDNARSNFESVLKNSDAPRTVRERALFGLARSLESLAGVQPKEGSPVTTQDAVEKYEQLLKEFPNTVYKDLATRRVDSLKTDASKEFYAWFRQQNPKPEDRPNPADGFLPPGHPGMGDDNGPVFLPQIPDRLKLPAPGDGAAPSLPAENQAPPFPEGGAAEPKPPATPETSSPPESAPKPEGAEAKPADPAADPKANPKPADGAAKPPADESPATNP